jgi:membrane-bound serine protease (ClpP class)
LSFVGAGATAGIIGAALARVVVSAAVAVVASIFVLRLVPRLPFGRSLTLDTALDADEGYASTPATDAVWLGRVGRTISPLRPAGFAEIDGQRIDVVSEGELIESGAPVVVARVDGNRIVVRRTGTST